MQYRHTFYWACIIGRHNISLEQELVRMREGKTKSIGYQGIYLFTPQKTYRYKALKQFQNNAIYYNVRIYTVRYWTTVLLVKNRITVPATFKCPLLGSVPLGGFSLFPLDRSWLMGNWYPIVLERGLFVSLSCAFPLFLVDLSRFARNWSGIILVTVPDAFDGVL